MIQLPKILDQKSLPACIVFAISGLANFYLKQRGIDDEIDAAKFFSLAARNPSGTNEHAAFKYGIEKGMPSMKGKIYKIKEYTFISPGIGNIQKALQQNGGLILGYKLHAGNFNNRIVNGSLTPPDDSHGMVIVGDDPPKFRLRIANSWGESFGEKGYFWMPYVLLTKYDTTGIFSFSLL